MRVAVFLFFCLNILLFSCTNRVYELNTVRVSREKQLELQTVQSKESNVVSKDTIKNIEQKAEATILTQSNTKPSLNFNKKAQVIFKDKIAPIMAKVVISTNSFQSINRYKVSNFTEPLKVRKRFVNRTMIYISIGIAVVAASTGVLIYFFVDRIVGVVILLALAWFGLYSMKIL